MTRSMPTAAKLPSADAQTVADVMTRAVVVVGVDGSDVSSVALQFAADEAHRRGARLVVAHAGSTTPPADLDSQVRPFDEIVCREAVAAVAALRPGLDCRVVRRDVEATALLNELSRTADLLVVGTHRTGPLRGWVLGSVSQYVAAHAACPVIAVSGPQEHTALPIVLGASASPGGLAALRFACEEARLRRVPVRAIRSITIENWALTGAGSVALGADVLYDAARAELDTVLTAAKESYSDVSVTGEVSTDAPFAALLNASTDTSLLVVGARRSRTSPLPRLGPVAAWLLHHALCPVAVVSHAAPDG